MNNNDPKFYPDLVVNSGQHPSGSDQLPHAGSQQQKRQNSLSNYMIANSNKRSQNPLPSSMQGSQDFYNASNNSTFNSTFNASQVAQAPGTPAVSSPRYPSVRSGARRSMIQQQPSMGNLKTPTHSPYEVPSSPNVNPMSNVSVQNHSDLSDSNAVLEHQMDANQNDLLPTAKDLTVSTPMNSSSHPRHPLQQPDLAQPQLTQAPPRTMSDEEQQLASKLKETYKNVVNFEEIVQKNCIDITIKINQLTSNNHNSSLVYGNSPLINQQLSSSVNSNTSLTSTTTRTSELLNDLWTVYHHNITLLDNYYDFLVTALKPSSNQTQFKTGKNIVELYKIPRRMWVYGIVGFLEVLKNIMSIYQDHEICLCFISYCFNIISNLTDPILEMEGWWLEKLGDLSRMAIALYASKFIDWKISAEYWYSVAMRTLYGHGKIYYHMCTVQQDNLDALVNIGKSVVCRDPFVPTQHYLRLVVENICTQRNILSLLELPIIDFIKIHKVLLSIFNRTNDGISNSVEGIHDSQVQYGIDLVTRYGLTFGSDSSGYNFFTRELYTANGVTSINDPHHPYYLQQQQQQQTPNAANSMEKINFWLNKGSLFAIANINHLIGFGDAKNPFAKIFLLPEALKERKDKKDRKRKSRASSQAHIDDSNNSITGGVDGQTVSVSDLSVNDWFYCLQFINKSVLELSIRILNHYLVGPKQASTSHVIVWLYFLIAVGDSSKKYSNSKTMVDWLFKKLFPWESLINYLNSLLSFVRNSPKLSKLCAHYLQQGDYIQYFNENEFLPEVWKCWGTLWFDSIVEKGDYTDLESAGVKNNNLFDLPVCGSYSAVNLASESDHKSRNQMENDNDERIVRIILLARIIADKHSFGLVRSDYEFKYDETIYNTTDSSVPSSNSTQNDPYAYMEEFLLSDGRFVQNNFLQPISRENLSNVSYHLTTAQKDNMWFRSNGGYDEENQLGDDMVQDQEGGGQYGVPQYEDEEAGIDSQHQQSLHNHHLYHQQQHQQALQQAQQIAGGEGFYNEIFIESGDAGVNKNKISIEGNLGDRMDNSLTHITLDTNIWLKHCGRIYKCVRNGVFKILIPLIVFQELRALRKSVEATISDAATRSVIIVRELYLTGEILPLRYDGSVASDINETLEFENNSNWRSCVDETILNAVNEHDEIGKKMLKGLNAKLSGVSKGDSRAPVTVLNHVTARMFRYCVLITDDRNMRLRAKTIGLTSFQSKWLFTQLESVFPYKCID
ncbi:uncharacterized protein CANTADRAFT_3763 [Suhomyces tanzawaensis NRRL Y-17324]|uniref:PIN domain-containing protein n=1 Tax=Suhomyces tanzawaensis NRRL Y-17324 TaxID=984487 RepID=A0A1E4SQ97_9ASCO|nr:uncharacterized protein CANTADRAFT_3763 [Suhomyces tanzawaensis NRRL Y-17324]ODV81681.1 hypothetical protein CANTADRAFT_3763 [Suhomyces tanzawaensis NRRL Y-17324]